MVLLFCCCFWVGLSCLLVVVLLVVCCWFDVLFSFVDCVLICDYGFDARLLGSGIVVSRFAVGGALIWR